jgi:formate C-acetyltransferase
MPLAEFLGVLRSDWAGREALRRSIRSRFELYGNDSPEADAMVRRVFDDYLALAAALRRDGGVLQPPGVSTFGRELAWLPERRAAAAGSRDGEPLATNFSPAPGTDRRGPTAVIKSHCSLGLRRLTNGTALELKMHPSSVTGENGLEALAGLMRAFVRLGGIFMQIDVVDSALLRDAQEHPDRHPNLAVRISGWSARFATLNREWQDLIINRTEQR